MEFLKYPHIDNLYKALEVVERGEVIATEKADGTNARIEFFLQDGVWNYRIGSRNLLLDELNRNAHMGFVGWVHDNLDVFKNALSFILVNHRDNNETELNALNSITFFGEWIGEGIQKRVNYCKGKTFYLFGIVTQNISDTVEMLAYDVRIEIANKVGLNHVPCLFRGHVKTEEALKTFNEVIKRNSQIATDNGLESIIEGVVIEPSFPCLNKFGRPLLAKHKTEEFSEIGKAKKDINPEEGFILKLSETFANLFVTEERINHVLSQCRERGEEIKNDMQDMKFLVNGIILDVERECADAFLFLDSLVERKKAMKQVSKRVSRLYEKIIYTIELEKQLIRSK